MAFAPNRTGPFCPVGEIVCVAPGTAIPLDSNWSPNCNPNTPTTPGGAVPEYSLRFDDLIINSPSTNVGGIYLVTYNKQGSAGGIGDPNTILLYIPKGSPPVSVAKVLGQARFNPSMIAFDFDQIGDKAWAVGTF